MSGLAILLVLVCAVGLLLLPRRWAAIPLLAGACYLPVNVGLEIGPFNFYPLRTLLVVAMLRAFLRREGMATSINGIDKAMLLWAATAIITSLFHFDPAAAFVNRLGLVYTACGSYFSFRVFLQSEHDVRRLFQAIVIILTPVGAAMLNERITGYNIFSQFGGVLEASEVRDGLIRSQGPFAHSILAGVIGAAMVPLMLSIIFTHRKTALAGLFVCSTIIITSGSSGPIISGVVALIALFMWPVRRNMRIVRYTCIVAYLGLELAMNAPAYYLVTRLDLTGSSTSWHRAALIEAALEHLSEWWLTGTDYTRHWMAYGALWSGDQADVTNYYIRMGIDGGLPLMLSFVVVLAAGFSLSGRNCRTAEDSALALASRYLPWALGASLIAHSAAFLSVSYFDQSVVFFYLTLGSIASIMAPQHRNQQLITTPEATVHPTPSNQPQFYARHIH